MIDTLKFQWNRLSTQEKAMMSFCIGLLSLALFWSAAVKPALRSIESSKARMAKASAQLTQIKSMDAQAQTLRGAPRASREAAVRGIEAAAAELPVKSNLRMNGTAMNVKIESASAQDIHQFISSARKAGSMPEQAELSLNSKTGQWSGTFEMRLPKENP